MALPHIDNSYAGTNHLDPVILSNFEIYFSLPDALVAQFGDDSLLLTQQVKSIDGLQSLSKGVELVEQKFMGTTRSALKPKPSTTAHDLTVVFNLNLRDGVDDYVFNLFMAWQKLSYDLSNGSSNLTNACTAPFMRLAIANRGNDVYREIIYKDVMLNGDLEGLGKLDYEALDPLDLTVHFRSDKATEIPLR